MDGSPRVTPLVKNKSNPTCACFVERKSEGSCHGSTDEQYVVVCSCSALCALHREIFRLALSCRCTARRSHSQRNSGDRLNRGNRKCWKIPSSGCARIAPAMESSSAATWPPRRGHP